MSDDEGFLARWSRRRRGAASNAQGRPTPEKAGSGSASEASANSPPSEETHPLVDLASLPPIDSIGAGSDIRAFLAPGVPADLARAALRRAWSADPTIRDFIGLSENSWDFNAPGGVPGFGSLEAEDVRRLLAQMTEEPKADEVAPRAAERPESKAPAPAPAGESAAANAGPAQDRPNEDQDTIAENSDRTDHANVKDEDIAMQQELGESECSPPLPRHHHGGALPE